MKLLTSFFMLALCTYAHAQQITWKGKPVDFSRGDLKVSDNHRFLQHDDGTPFFYLGDTAWELFHRSTQEEANYYLQKRASQGYSVIQAVALAELDGHTVPNMYGYLPFNNLNPSEPAITGGADNDYWDHVDYIIEKANNLGLYVGLLPTWGSFWHDDNKLIFNKKNAEEYGKFIANRYKDKKIIWILGGDRPVTSQKELEIIRAMAKGIKSTGTKQLITLHPPGGAGSAQWVHNEPWLDFNMRQNGHSIEYTDRYETTYKDYNRQPVKPVMDAEPVYEGHPVNFNPDKQGHSMAADVRRPLYWNLFSGAFGHTYGHHSVWQFFDEKRTPINRPIMGWREALDQPGAQQMMYGRMLMESRPFLSRIPDSSIIISDQYTSLMPGEGIYKFVATRDIDRSYAMIYAPAGRKFSVNMEIIKGNKIVAWWYNPRNGTASKIGIFNNNGNKEFTPPLEGELLDWILVLDDKSKNYPAPGIALKK